MESSEGQSSGRIHNIQAHFQGHFGGITGEVKIQIIKADSIEVAPSNSVKYLRLRSGDYEVNREVYLVIDNRRVEITVDSLPED